METVLYRLYNRDDYPCVGKPSPRSLAGNGPSSARGFWDQCVVAETLVLFWHLETIGPSLPKNRGPCA